MKNPILVYQAKSFYNAFILLEQTKVEDDELLLVVPRLVYGAFSVEVTLKAILTEQGISYGKEHNLKTLFEKLPFEIQNQIWGYLEFAPQPSPNQAIADNRSIEQRICIKPAKRSRQRDLSLLVRFMQRRATPITQKDVSRR